MSSPPLGHDAGHTPKDELKSSVIIGLNPIGLMEGVLGGQATDWEPPLAEDLESFFPGYTGFRFIDRGGMGAVYSATQNSLDRRVAVKILPPDLSKDAVFVDSFHREARLLARLQHPHIVAVYDFGRNDQGHLYIVMEYVEGTSLFDIMKRETLPLPRALEVVTQVCEALQFAHDHGVIHRDIKPTNILIDSRNRVRVADFGLAKLVRADITITTTTTAQTRSAFIMGTPVYAAPEQRHRSHELDHRADIFSLGVTLYEMLTGRFPVGVFEPPSKAAGSPHMLDKIITKSLRENPNDRYQSAADLSLAVRKASDRITKPAIQRAIAQRPVVSMMTTVIITAALIYLFDEVNRQVLQKIPPSRLQAPHNLSVVRLNDTFSLLNSRMTWQQAQDMPNATLASIHSPAEMQQLRDLLEEHGIHSGVWTGGVQPEAGAPFAWTDQTPWDFEDWMPASAEPPVVVTEIQAKNTSTLRTSRGDTPDWIELHNPGPQPVDLTGWKFTHYIGREFFEERLGASMKPGTPSLILAPGEYRVIFCSEISEDDASRPQIHFRLEAQRGRIAWTDPRGRVIQMFSGAWNNFPPNSSITSQPDGQIWGVSPKPTPGQPNMPPVRSFNISVQPKPERHAVMLLPQFNSRWTTTPLDRLALPLIRSKKN